MERGILAPIPALWLVGHATSGQSPASSEPSILIEVGPPGRVERVGQVACNPLKTIECRMFL